MDIRRFAWIILAVLVLAGCKNTGGQAASDEDAKLQYSPQVNEVEVVTLARQDFPMQLLSNGKLSAAQRSALYFRQSGGVLTRIAGSNGTRVAKGQVIAEIESSEQRAALESAKVDLDRATLDLQDALVGQGYPVNAQDNVPEEVLKVAKIRSGYTTAVANYDKAKRALDGTVLRAPFAGKLADIKLKVWETPGSEPFCTVINDSSFDVVFTVLESEYPFVAVGLPVRVFPFGSEDEFVRGSITSINPSIDRNGQISVTARIPGGGRLVDGMNVKVLVDRILEKQLVVPKSAVVIRDGLEVVFRYNNGKADWVYVHTIQANSESYAIEANRDRGAQLAEGEQIIVSGNLNLADGSKVQLKQ